MNIDLVLQNILSYCDDRDAIFRVCKLWRTNYFWVDPVQTYINALKYYNIPLARLMWEYYSERIIMSVDWKTAFYWSCSRGLLNQVESFRLFKPENERDLLTCSVRCACMHDHNAVITQLIEGHVHLINFRQEANRYHDARLYKYNMDMKKKFGVVFSALSCAIISENLGTVAQLFDLVNRETDGNAWTTMDVVDGFGMCCAQACYRIAEFLLLSSTGVAFAVDVAEQAAMMCEPLVTRALFACFERDKTIDLSFLFEILYNMLFDDDDEEEADFHGTDTFGLCAQYSQFPMHLCDNALFTQICKFGELHTVRRAYKEGDNIDLTFNDWIAFRHAARVGNLSALTFFLDRNVPFSVVEEEVEKCATIRNLGFSYDSETLLNVFLHKAKRDQKQRENQQTHQAKKIKTT